MFMLDDASLANIANGQEEVAVWATSTTTARTPHGSPSSCSAAGRAAEIPRYLRQGVLPEMVERELAKPSNSATSRYSSARDIAPELERRLPREE
jgi:hypothetical protein